MRSLSVFCILILLPFYSSIWASQPTISFPIPQKVQFAGQTISLQRYDFQERYDREQLVIAYNHSVSLLQIKRAQKYFPIIEPILKENGIPTDFKYLAVIESNLDIRAYSPAKAAGFWQLLPKTAEQFGLEVNDQIDERYHIEKSTQAACKYLKSAYNKFQSWTTTAISYNAGMGRISEELDKQQVSEGLDLLLSSESGRYIFRLMAMIRFRENPEYFGYKVEKDDFYQQVKTQNVLLADSVGNWTDWAKQYKITYAQLKEANPWLRDRNLSNPNKKQYSLVIPIQN